MVVCRKLHAQSWGTLIISWVGDVILLFLKKQLPYFALHSHSTLLSCFSLDLSLIVQTIQCYNNKLNSTQFHSPCFKHAGPNFLKQGPHFLGRDWSSGGLIVFIVVIVHDNIRTRRVALLRQAHLGVGRIQQSWKHSRNRLQIWFWPVVAACRKYCQSCRGHGGHDLTSSQMLSRAPSLLGGRPKLHCDPLFFLDTIAMHVSHDSRAWFYKTLKMWITSEILQIECLLTDIYIYTVSM